MMAYVVLSQSALLEHSTETDMIRNSALGLQANTYAGHYRLGAKQVGQFTNSAGLDGLTQSRWIDPERLIVRTVDGQHHYSTVFDATWQAASATWPQDQFIKLIFASASYDTAAFVINAAHRCLSKEALNVSPARWLRPE